MVRPPRAWQLSLRVGFFSPDYAVRGSTPMWGGAAYYRCRLPARELARHGFETFTSPVVVHHNETRYLTGLDLRGYPYPDPDVMVIHSWPEDGAENIAAAVAAGQIVIGDMDDLIWDLPAGHQAEGLVSPEKNVANMAANFRACSALTVTTPMLAQWMAANWEDCPPVYIVRNAIDFDAFSLEPMAAKARTIGWTGNPLWRADDLSLFRPWLGAFLARHKLRFAHVGAIAHAGTIADQLGISPGLLVEVPFRTFLEWRTTRPLRGIDLQVIPLIDCDWNRAKSALKGLESAAWGVPFVSSGSPEYFEVFGDDPRPQLEEAIGELLSWRRRREVHALQYSRACEHDISTRWVDWAATYEKALAAS